MAWSQVLLLCAVLAVSWCAEDLTFPPGFRFGAATASYQVEGAWNVSDKSENVWDRHTHMYPERVADRSNGDIACDSYHLWRRDIEMAEELGLHFYRFSLSWTRLLPSGFANYISEDGKNYYNNLIDGLLEKGIEPVVTLYHWDLPQSLQDLGGWTNPLVVEWFTDYARVAFTLFGDRVKMWLTLNEPIVICDAVYNTDSFAPGIVSPDVATYICNKNLLLAHATAWRLYDEEFKPKYQGKVSLANQAVWIEPLSKGFEELAELAIEYCTGRYSHAIYSNEGGWPPALEKVLAELSVKKGFPESVLPPFTPEEIDFIRGTYDFYAMNHYTSSLIRPAREGEVLRPWPLGDIPDINAVLERPDSWSSELWVNPEGFRKQIVWLKEHYGDIEIVITENGKSTKGGLDDQERVDYYREYLKQLLLAIKKDGVNVTGYTAWTIMDNFEWVEGYSSKFGLYEVDFSDPMRTRTPRASAHYYADIIKAHSLDVPTP